jgi:cephalosporin hydroxylase
MGYKDIVGWCDFEDIYDDMVSSAPQEGAIIVEVGVCFGRSLAYLARKVIESGKNIKVVGVDPWDITEFDPRDVTARELFAKHGSHYVAYRATMKEFAPEELARITEFRGTSLDAAKSFEDESVWGVFIDGQHEYAPVLADITAWRKKVARGGWLAGHDYNPGQFPGVVAAVNEAFGDRFAVRTSSWVAETDKQ